MSIKVYFYLEGAEKKGPFSKEEIIKRNLPNDTLIFEEKLNKWLPISNFKEFENKRINTDKKIKIPKNLILLFLAILSSIIAYYATEHDRKSDYELLQGKISSFFGGKAEICDYREYGIEGELRKAKYYDGIWDFEKRDNENKELYEVFRLNSGGWTVYSLSDVNLNDGYRFHDSYKYEEYEATDMGFKVRNDRITVQAAYNEALKALSNNSYSAGSLDRINSFRLINSKYYYISVGETWSAPLEGKVFTKSWIVWYKALNGTQYVIIRDDAKYNSTLITNILIGAVLSFLIFLIWKYNSRISIG